MKTGYRLGSDDDHFADAANVPARKELSGYLRREAWGGVLQRCLVIRALVRRRFASVDK